MKSRPAPTRISSGRRIVYGVVAVLLPFLLIVLLELVARAVGVGSEDQDAFVPLPGYPEYRGFNPMYAQRYFQGFTPSVAPNVFKAEKPENTVRLFVLGGSTTAGYPYLPSTSFPAQLARMLDRRFLDRQVEVVNLGMTAVSSYTLWDLRTAVLDERPDAVLIYAGHNEFYGAFGAGSTVYALGNRVWLKRLVLFLKHSVLFRALDRPLTRFSASPDPDAGAQTMMARLAGEQEIALNGDVYSVGIRQFESNLSQVIASFTRAGVPVFISTITSNLRDQPPLGDDSTAAAQYRLGLQLADSGLFAEARQAFSAARDHDPIRFRAPSEINDAIRRTAVAKGAILVDSEERLRLTSENRLEGDDLFVDHLHPTAEGYTIIAASFLEKLDAHFAYDGPALTISGDRLRLDLLDSAAAAINVERLLSGFPFVKGRVAGDENESLKRLVDSKLSAGTIADSLAMLMLMNRLAPHEALRVLVAHSAARRDTSNALLLYRSLTSLEPLSAGLMQEAVRLASPTTVGSDPVGDIALHGLKRTGDPMYGSLLAAWALHRGQLDDARLLLDRLEREQPDDPTMLFNQARLHVLLGDTARARDYFLRYRGARWVLPD